MKPEMRQQLKGKDGKTGKKQANGDRLKTYRTTAAFGIGIQTPQTMVLLVCQDAFFPSGTAQSLDPDLHSSLA